MAELAEPDDLAEEQDPDLIEAEEQCETGGAPPEGAEFPQTPWSRPWQDLTRELDVDPEVGLAESDVPGRREHYGPNCLVQPGTANAFLILLNQFRNIVVLLLVVAAALSFAFGETVEGIAVAAVIVINAAIGFGTEIRAARSMEALQRMGRVMATVRRDGRLQEVEATLLVPGDALRIEAGHVIPADVRVTEASRLECDESALTGESVPVGKSTASSLPDAPLAERPGMLFAGTPVTRGAGEGIVVATGMATELGRIASLVAETEEETTPLQKRLDQMGHRLVWVTLGIAAAVSLAGILAGRETLLMIETGIALAVATIPEGLPIVATTALARGMWRMARRNALVNRLSAVETLGATTVICTDKTGTLTENRMSLVTVALEALEVTVTGDALGARGEFLAEGERLEPRADARLREALEVGVLCNGADITLDAPEPKTVGDPLEVALLVAGAKAGLSREALLEAQPERREEPFDSDVAMMATFHEADGAYRVAVKGAPEAVLPACAWVRKKEGTAALDQAAREEWLKRDQALGATGLRVLAVATKAAPDLEAEAYEGLTLVGLLGLVDPARPDAAEAIEDCRGAGIDVVMVTGDQAATARNIAAAVGLGEEGEEALPGRELGPVDRLTTEQRQRFREANIFFRVSPEQKLNLVTLHQESGAVVAMTGDGVNDAPALKKADIGVAMGHRGTQVAREAADMVLLDDAFSSIVFAVEQGRIIFGNIRRFVYYLVSCNVSEVLIVGLASLVNVPLPILPLQILFLNLVTDVFPALALGVGEGERSVMQSPPRDPKEPLITRAHWLGISGHGIVISAAVLSSLALAMEWLGMSQEEAVTISFLTLACAQLWHVFNMREADSGLLRNDVTSNSYVWAALALCLGLLFIVVYVPSAANVLKLVNPGIKGWALVLVMSLVPLVIGQLVKVIRVGRQAT